MANAPVRNSQQVNALSSDFVGKRDPYSGIHGIMGMIPGKVLVANFDTFDRSNGNMLDVHASNTLTATGTPVYSLLEGAIPYVTLSGSTYFSITDANKFDITGTETSVGTGYKGLTMGCVFKPTLSVTTTQGLITKWAVNQQSFIMFVVSSVVRAHISSNGINNITINSPEAPVLNSWNVVVFRYKPSVSLEMWINNAATPSILSTGVFSSIFNSTAALQVGAYNNGGARLTGGVGMGFVSAMALPDEWIALYLSMARASFGI